MADGRVGMLFLAFAVLRCPGAWTAPEPPQVLYQDLFVAVQMAAIYPDGKTFADAVPNSAPAEVLKRYHAAPPRSADELKHFVASHFSLPAYAGASRSAADSVPIESHIDLLWGQLTRITRNAPPYSSVLPLPHPYVVPGGRFREMYYWDSYFTMLGLVQSGRGDLVAAMVANFSALIDRYGFIPNGTRTYYLSRSQPPFFFAMVGLLTADDPASAYARYLPQLQREYAFWMNGAAGLKPGTAKRRVVMMRDGSVLNRYWDDRDTPRDESYREDVELARASGRPANDVFRDVRAAAESGWDFSSRWLADQHTLATIMTTRIVPVDLNSLLFGLETAIGAGCERRHDRACVRDFTQRAMARRASMDRYLWDATGVYRDYDWTRGTQMPQISAATLYPLFFGVSSAAQADAITKVVATDLLNVGGILTTPTRTGQQWDAPNGWAPLQWIAVAGLRRYGQWRLAETVACRWMINVLGVYRQTGRLVEKYDVINTGRPGGGGEYPSQDGFGWTNGVMRKLLALYPADATYTTPSQCPPG